MKYKALTFALVSCLPFPLHAQESEPIGEDKDQLLALLDEQTAIATRTRMNADYVPGMVTVLHGDELEARGARTVWEAMALVPGMEMAIEKTGRRKVLVRGLGNTWASGNVKILLNDVSMNSAELGLAEPVFNIPVEQVDRIEVIRGPGSAIYGEFAYMGVINVVTRSDKSRLVAFGGSFDTKGLGATVAFTSLENPVQASLNLAGWSTSGADTKTGEDLLYGVGVGHLSNAPGRANEDVDAGTAVFKVGYQRFALTAQWTQDGLGDHFGMSYYLPPDANKIVERTRHRTVDMRQDIPLTPALTAGIQFNWRDVQRQRRGLYISPAPDTYLDSDYLETSTSLGTDFTYRGWDRHILLMGASTGGVRVDTDTANPPNIIVPEGTTRDVTAITLQDEFRQSDLFTLTTGLRYDEFSDVGTSYSPRIAGVWRINESHIIKAQYAQAFRPPTLYEIASAEYWNQAVPNAATIRTSEVGYIYKGTTAETRVTGFYSQMKDLVAFIKDRSSNAASFGRDSATAWGVELEQNWRISPQWALDGNASYVDSRDDETGDPFPGAAEWIANAGISYKRGTFLGALQAHHVSNYFREPEDPRSTRAGYTTLDLTGTFSHLLTRGMQLRIGVKNLFDARVRYPAPTISATPDPNDPTQVIVVPTYADDYPQSGRSWWAQLGYQF